MSNIIKILENQEMGFLYDVKMSKKTLNLDYVEVNQEEFHASIQPVALDLVVISQLALSEKFIHSGKGYKYFFGYEHDDIIRPLCIVLTQISQYIKYFDSCGKIMSFTIEDNSVLVKYNSI